MLSVDWVWKGTLKTHFTHCLVTFMQNYKRGKIAKITSVQATIYNPENSTLIMKHGVRRLKVRESVYCKYCFED